MSGPTLSLFRYLILNHGRAVRRECLAELLWDALEPERRRHALNTAVWRLQKTLSALPGLDLETDKEVLRLRILKAVAIDVETLKQHVDQAELDGITAHHMSRLADSLDQTHQAFFGGDVEDWALSERERISNLRVRGLIVMMQALGEQKRYEEALHYGRLILGDDPYREAVQCELMWLYVLNGQRAQAIRQFTAYRDLLREELGIEPMAETCALFDHIRSGLNGALPHPPGQNPTPMTSFHGVLNSIEQSRHDLYRALCAHTRQPA